MSVAESPRVALNSTTLTFTQVIMNGGRGSQVVKSWRGKVFLRRPRLTLGCRATQKERKELKPDNYEQELSDNDDTKASSQLPELRHYANGRNLSLDGFNMNQPLHTTGLLWHQE
ncbi:hypothetical protein TNCV_1184501 [Trichonephila clavipes]|nr:hypothetical protein TNCV_1184501 [Trichonephila clavipes]